MGWTLRAQTDQTVTWRRSEDDFDLTFVKKGFGEPWSDTGAPPAEIDNFAPPIIKTPVAVLPPITKFAFRMRFTPTERTAVEMAALDDPSASIEMRQLAAGLRAQLRDFELAESIQLDHPELMDAVRGLESYGLISLNRADEILTTPPVEAELA